MKWLFAILTIAIEILIDNFTENYLVIIFICFGIAGLFIKSINKSNSVIQNQIAWGLLIGTFITMIMYGIVLFWLIKQFF